MPDILDQGEVDALLQAVRKGKVSGVGARPGATSPSETAKRGEGEYDFTKPERVTKEQQRALHAIHDIFARGLSSSLSGLIRAIVDVRLIDVEQATYGEYINSLPNPTSFNLLHIMPMDGTAVLELNPEAIFPLIDRMLGGSTGAGSALTRPLTQIEQHLVSTIIGRATEQLEQAWSNLEKLSFTLTNSESNPHLMQIHSPNEPVVVINYESRIGKSQGAMSLCYPYRVIEPVINTFTAQTWLTQAKTPEKNTVDALRLNLGKAALDLNVYLAETEITLADLVALKPGHIIQTGKPANSEITLAIGGKLKYKGTPGVFKNHKAFLATRPARPGENI